MATDRTVDRDGALVEFKLRADGVNVIARAFDASGKPVEVPAKIMFFPQFFSPGEQVRLGTVEIITVRGDDKNSVFRSAMDVSGRAGVIRMPRVEEEGSVMPMFMSEPRIQPPVARDVPEVEAS
jgi:hypothetical protein